MNQATVGSAYSVQPGYSFATYSSKSHILTLHSHSHPPSTLFVPKLELLFTYPTPTSTTFSTHTDQATFTNESIFGITPDFDILHVRIEANTGRMVLHSHDRLPILPKLPSTTAETCLSESSGTDSEGPKTPNNPPGETVLSESPSSNGKLAHGSDGNAVKKIIPVDPMAWGWGWDEWDDYRKSSITGSPILTRSRSRFSGSGVRNGRGGWEEHDVLLSVSECGELAFWVPEAYASSSGGDKRVNGNGLRSAANGWRCTGRVRTERKGFNRARCSSAKKTALGMLFPLCCSYNIYHCP